jgi:hypothetical protein
MDEEAHQIRNRPPYRRLWKHRGPKLAKALPSEPILL